MKIYNIQQQSPEWFEIRKLKMTASKAQAIGNNGPGLKTYIKELIKAGCFGEEKERYSNSYMDNGNELEPQARLVYELETGNSVEQVGFIEYNEYVGCSPDGLVGKDGGIEIKCLSDYEFMNLLSEDLKVASDYEWQIQMNLLITGRKWWDYVVYNPNFNPSILIKRVVPDPEKVKGLLEGFEKGTNEIKEIINKLEKYKYNKK
ncbi:MAG: hypothetical protein EOL97_14075 [Spirochaetia bacterium]|nr:hypothetical protein [Spirochaetia bacterium]